MIRKLLLVALLLPSLASADRYSTAILADSPRGYYRMDASSGTAEVDLGADAVNAAYNGGFTLSQAGALPCCADTAASFNGSTGYLSRATMTNGTTTTNLAGYSEEFWVKLTASHAGTITLLALSDGSAFNHVVNVNGTGSGLDGRLVLQFYNACGVAAENLLGQAGNIPSDSAWYQVVVTTIGRGSGKLDATMYVNATQINTVSNTGTSLCTNFYNLNMGRRNDSANYVTGVFDELSYYNVQLSQAQVTAHYNASRVPTTTGLPFSVKRDRIPKPWSIVPEMPQARVDMPGFLIDRLNKATIRAPGTYR